VEGWCGGGNYWGNVLGRCRCEGGVEKIKREEREEAVGRATGVNVTPSTRLVLKRGGFTEKRREGYGGEKKGKAFCHVRTSKKARPKNKALTA